MIVGRQNGRLRGKARTRSSDEDSGELTFPRTEQRTRRPLLDTTPVQIQTAFPISKLQLIFRFVFGLCRSPSCPRLSHCLCRRKDHAAHPSSRLPSRRFVPKSNPSATKIPPLPPFQITSRSISSKRTLRTRASLTGCFEAADSCTVSMLPVTTTPCTHHFCWLMDGTWSQGSSQPGKQQFRAEKPEFSCVAFSVSNIAGSKWQGEPIYFRRSATRDGAQVTCSVETAVPDP